MEKGLFGLKSELETASIVCIPVPWDVSSSYGDGAHQGPELILQASPQIDFFDEDKGLIYKRGLFMLPIDKQIQRDNAFYRKKALQWMQKVEEKGEENLHKISKREKKLCLEIDEACAQVHKKIHEKAKELLKKKKLCCLLGGDHSTAYGLIQAIGESVQGDFSLLQLDAHADLRPTYQGLKHSHASIMFRILEGDFAPKTLVQVGVRDLSKEEWNKITEQKGPGQIHCFSNQQLQRRLFQGENWNTLCEDIVKTLSSKVYVSFDVDVLKSYLCPQTGTPVPGGLELEQVFFLLHKVHQSGRKIIGFDLCEVSGGSKTLSQEVRAWNGNVGCRILYKLSGWIES